MCHIFALLTISVFCGGLGHYVQISTRPLLQNLTKIFLYAIHRKRPWILNILDQRKLNDSLDKPWCMVGTKFTRFLIAPASSKVTHCYWSTIYGSPNTSITIVVLKDKHSIQSSFKQLQWPYTCFQSRE